MGRTASPFLNAVANGTATRPKSPLVGGSGTPPTAATGQAVPAAAVRKTTTIGTATRKPNILGAKKKTGLGAKKIDIDLDFDAAEKKAKEEAQRIEKLGYDPNGEAAEEASGPAKFASATIGEIASPTPISPRAGFGATQATERGGDVKEVGASMARLGFGQVGAGKAAAAPKKMGGFGSTSRPQAGKSLSLVLMFIFAHFRCQILHQPQRERSSVCRKVSVLTSSSVATNSTPVSKQKLERDYKASKVPLRSRVTHTSAGLMRRVPMANMVATWKVLPRTSSDSLASQLEMILRMSRNWLARVLTSLEVCARVVVVLDNADIDCRGNPIFSKQLDLEFCKLSVLILVWNSRESGQGIFSTTI